MLRREFVVLAASVAGCASIAVTSVAPDADGVLVIDLALFPALAQPGGMLRVRPAGSSDALYVLALGNDRFATVSPICKHRGCTVDAFSDRLECPCHGSQYMRDGSLLRGPASASLDTFPTTQVDGRVLIDVRSML